MAAAGKSILCIDTDQAGLLLRGALLEDNGYRVLTATCGHEGLQLFVAQAVDAILVDYHLGLLDGGVVADEIKRVRPEARVVMLTEHGEVPREALKSVDAFVFKSHGPGALLAALHAVLEASSDSAPDLADRQADRRDRMA
jgi:CheY-like chemotaxis protein